MSNEGTREDGPARTRKGMRTGSFCSRKVLVIGVTGGVATGKTTVARMLADLGADLLNADEVVHAVLERSEDVRRQLIEAFGRAILADEGNVDRRKLGRTVFKDPASRARLERIVHPPVLELLESEIRKFREEGKGVLVVEIPLLVETSSFGLVDKVLVVTAEQETQIERLKKRYGASEEEARLRVQSQLPIDEKLKYADWVVSTEVPLSCTKEQVGKVWDVIQERLAQRN